MEQQQQMAIAGLEQALERKGYRKKFYLAINDPAGTQRSGTLKECLAAFIDAYQVSGKNADSFRLYTYPYFKSDEDYITAKFQLRLDETKGFVIRSLEIDDKVSGQHRTYKLNSNTQIPPAGTLKALFPRRTKPWEFWKRGFKH